MTMPVPLLDLRAQHATIRDEVVAAMMEVVDSQSFILGAPVERARSARSPSCRTRTYAVGCANGTDALLLALRALDAGPGDEVITTPFTFFATAGTIHNVGATPGVRGHRARHVQHPPEARGRRAITSQDQGRRAGGPVRPDGARSRTSRRLAQGIPVIEDAAQIDRRAPDRSTASGAWPVRSATIGTFSFFPSKNLGGYGDGGMMVTQDEALADAAQAPADARRLARQYFHDEVGYNSRLDALQAAVLSAKLPHLAAWSAKRRANAAYYDAAFADVAEVDDAVRSIRPTSRSSISTRCACERRDELQAHLKARGIGTSVYYPLPLHLQPCFAYLGYKAGALSRVGAGGA